MKTRLKILLLRKVESWISTKMIQQEEETVAIGEQLFEASDVMATQVLDHVVDTEIDDDVGIVKELLSQFQEVPRLLISASEFGAKIHKPPDVKEKLLSDETLGNLRRVKELMGDVRFNLVPSKEDYIPLKNVVKLKHTRTGFLYGSYYAEQSCDCDDVKQLIHGGDMEYYMKHRGKSKQSRTDSVFKRNNHSNFANVVLKPSLMYFGFDGNGFCIDSNGKLLPPIKMLAEVMSGLFLLLKLGMRSKCKGDSLMKAVRDVLVAQRTVGDLANKWLLNTEDGTNRVIANEDMWSYMRSILKELCVAEFEVATKTVKKSLEGPMKRVLLNFVGKNILQTKLQNGMQALLHYGDWRGTSTTTICYFTSQVWNYALKAYFQRLFNVKIDKYAYWTWFMANMTFGETSGASWLRPQYKLSKFSSLRTIICKLVLIHENLIPSFLVTVSF
ncbi:hypothetical protein YC2023_104541 [Brassica napus]